ncbi:MAG: GDSL-type esterase/lipase family protein [Pseudomonadota bacterium]
MKKKLLIISILSFLLLSLSGCSAGTLTKPEKTNAVINDGATPLAASTASAKNNTSSTSAINVNTFTGTNSRLMGRFDRNTNGQAKFTWPGSTLEFRFEGSKASINIASQTRVRFVVNLDGNPRDLWIEPGNHTYVLAANIGSGIHTVQLTRVSESSAGITSFISDPHVIGTLLKPPQAPQKRLLVIGDSITAGYGVEGANERCHYALDNSNQQLTYSALAASRLGADLHTIAWSGIGAWRTYGEKTPASPTILTRSTRTLADDATSVWNPSQYMPDAILINIGTNDYWDGSATAEYQLGMKNLIAKVQSDYPGKPIYLIVSPMLTNKIHESQKQVLGTLTSNKVKLLDLIPNDGTEGLGCDYHPNTTTHTRLSKALEKTLKIDLHW